MFKVNNKDHGMPLAFRIFDSLRHHYISNAFGNICIGNGRRCCRKKVTKSKIGSKGSNLSKRRFNSTKISNQSSLFLHPIFLTLIILPPETVKLNVTKSYIVAWSYNTKQE